METKELTKEEKIREAAPDLLEALREAINIQKENYGNGIKTHLALITWVKKAEKAINKALK